VAWAFVPMKCVSRASLPCSSTLPLLHLRPSTTLDGDKSRLPRVVSSCAEPQLQRFQKAHTIFRKPLLPRVWIRFVRDEVVLFLLNDQNRTRCLAQDIFSVTAIEQANIPGVSMSRNDDELDLPGGTV
jgi:hypothetical protein